MGNNGVYVVTCPLCELDGVIEKRFKGQVFDSVEEVVMSISKCGVKPEDIKVKSIAEHLDSLNQSHTADGVYFTYVQVKEVNDYYPIADLSLTDLNEVGYTCPKDKLKDIADELGRTFWDNYYQSMSDDLYYLSDCRDINTECKLAKKVGDSEYYAVKDFDGLVFVGYQIYDVDMNFICKVESDNRYIYCDELLELIKENAHV